jgi:CRP-like cAMP-binding protein
VETAAIDALARVPLFADLEREELQLLADAMRKHSFAAGDTVTTEGGDADGFFVIQSGEANVTVEGQLRRTISAGDFFGEIALLMGAERTATIEALTDLHCYALTPLEFREVVEGNPVIAWKLFGSMEQKLS